MISISVFKHNVHANVMYKYYRVKGSIFHWTLLVMTELVVTI